MQPDTTIRTVQRLLLADLVTSMSVPAELLCRGLCAVVFILAATVLPAAQARPSRIVSTSPSITETLFALGVGDRVVAVSTYCRFPEAARALPKIGTYLKPDTEAIARQRPDLVLVHDAAVGVRQRLAGLKIRAVAIEQRSNLASVYASIRQVAVASGVATRGETLITELQQRLNAVRSAAPAGRRPRVLFIVGRRPGTLSDLIGVGPGSYLNELMQVAGATNVLDIAGQPEYPRITMEAVLRFNPDVIIDTVDMGDTDAARAVRQPINERLWSAYPQLAAVQRQRVHAVSNDALVVPGPRVADAAQWIARVLEGGRR